MSVWLGANWQSSFSLSIVYFPQRTCGVKGMEVLCQMLYSFIFRGHLHREKMVETEKATSNHVVLIFSL